MPGTFVLRWAPCRRARGADVRRPERKDLGNSAGSPGVNQPAAALGLSREQAFRAYVEPEIEILLRVAQTLTGSWPDAEDVVQETLIRAWRAVDRFDGAHPRAWLLTILRRTHLNSLRRRRPDLLGEGADLDGQQPAFGRAGTPSPEQQHVEREFSTRLEQAMGTLHPRYRSVLLLIDVDQLSYDEAARVLDIPVGTVMSRLSRGRDKLRHQLRGTAAHKGHTP